MANCNCTSSSLPTRALVSRMRRCWAVLDDVSLVLEMRDKFTQDRNPTMTHTLGFVMEEFSEILDELEWRYDHERHNV